MKLVVEKKRFLAELHHLSTVIRQYQDFLGRLGEREGWESRGIQLARDHHIYLNQAQVSLKSVELVEALVRDVLKNLPVEQLTFKPIVTSASSDNGAIDPPPNDNAPQEALNQLTAQLQSLARHAPFSMQERIRFLLVSISSLFNGLIEGDEEKVRDATNQINLLTSSRESQNLIREIAFIAREIYDSLKAVTDDMPLSDLSETTEGISEAVRKLKSVISRLEEMANQNLDAIEKSTAQARETQKLVQEICGGLRAAQQKLGKMRAAHPEVAEAASQVQDHLGDGIGATLMMLQVRYQASSDQYLALMSNQSFQDLTGQTLKKIIDFIESLELQLVDLLEKYRPVLGLTASKAPPRILADSQESPNRQDQDQVDALLADLGF